jgi:predicted RND superfamily exporter protein
VLLIAAVVFAGSSLLAAARLRLVADLSSLLPPDAPAVRDLQRLNQRVLTRDTALAIVVAPDPGIRAAAVLQFAEGARAISRDLVQRVDHDDEETRAFFRARKQLYLPLPDLIEARDALARVKQRTNLARNPLFVDLDDEPDPVAPDAALRSLIARSQQVDTRLERSSFTSMGTIGLVVIGTAFSTTDVDRGRRLLDQLVRLRAEVMTAHPGVVIGFTGGVVTTLAEQRALVTGVMWSSIITAVLVVALLLGYLRSSSLVVMLVVNVLVAIMIAFGIAVFTVGHLNVATAFLGAIMAGNGINYGILLAARYREERVKAEPGRAMGEAIFHTLRPTLVAALGAAIAYGSLAATSFRGFADFATIGSVGMILCWVASYTLLPVLILRFAPGRKRVLDPATGWLGRGLARMFASTSPTRMCVLAAGLVLMSLGIAVRYVASDPFEYDLHALRASTRDADDARRWIRFSDANFGKSISGRIVFAADRRDQVPMIVDAVQAIDIFLPPEDRVVGAVSSILDVIPRDQDARLRVMSEIRDQLDDPLLQSALNPEELDQLRALRPPDDLRPVTEADLPSSIRESLTERDGRIGYLISVRPGPRLDQRNGHDLLRLASAIRSIRLADGETVTTSGSSVVFADIVGAIQRDGPAVTGLAALLLIVMVLFVVQRRRAVLAVLVATAFGTLMMVAICAVIGLRVNFLDFVALPITLGIGIDYAINIAHRASESDGPASVLRTSGSAVLVCSLTTVIGYASLLISEHGAIRSLGLPLLIGEITCAVAAFALVPALMFVSPSRLRRLT